MITDHVWRPTYTSGACRGRDDATACWYMNCRKPRTEHARSIRTQGGAS